MAAALKTHDRPLSGVDGPGVRLLVLSNPAKRGAVDAAALDRLAQAAEAATADGVRVLVLTGEDRAFCSGYDLDSLVKPECGPVVRDMRSRFETVVAGFDTNRRWQRPVKRCLRGVGETWFGSHRGHRSGEGV